MYGVHPLASREGGGVWSAPYSREGGGVWSAPSS